MIDERAPTTAERHGYQVGTAGYQIATLIGAIGLLIAALAWLVHLESTLPEIRAPRTTTSTQLLPGHRLMSPGHHDIEQVDTETEGDWLIQEVGDRRWLATDQTGSRLRAVFYGTELELIARLGPEAGRAYVTVDGSPVESFPSDELGSYVNLWALEATDSSVQVATGLAHGEHLVEITAGEGDLAVSGFEVTAQTPFPWAFVLAYAGLGGALFFAVRRLLDTLSSRRASTPPASSDYEEGSASQ